MNVQAYLKRINYTQPLKADQATLFQLHQAHLYNVPFEDLNIHYKIPIILKEKELYQKIVAGNRGGFCYELNGLFNELLKAIGFQTTIIAAKVINKEDKVGPSFDHAAIIVDLEKRWLVVQDINP
ncbi:MAG: arylamine N-acetyltransferase [Saprospiraceae bacterium]